MGVLLVLVMLQLNYSSPYPIEVLPLLEDRLVLGGWVLRVRRVSSSSNINPKS